MQHGNHIFPAATEMDESRVVSAPLEKPPRILRAERCASTPRKSMTPGGRLVLESIQPASSLRTMDEDEEEALEEEAAFAASEKSRSEWPQEASRITSGAFIFLAEEGVSACTRVKDSRPL